MKAGVVAVVLVDGEEGVDGEEVAVVVEDLVEEVLININNHFLTELFVTVSQSVYIKVVLSLVILR